MAGNPAGNTAARSKPLARDRGDRDHGALHRSCVAIFSMVRAVLLADFGYAGDRSAWRSSGTPVRTSPGVVGVSPGDIVSYRSSLQTVDGLAAVTTRGFNLGGGVTPARITCARMTAGMFPLLGVRASHGRWFID